MQYFFALIYSIFLPIVCLKHTTTRLCINCKFFINNGLSYTGKCFLFPKVNKSPDFLVVGIENLDYTMCSTARKYNDMCGKKGNKYISKLSKNDKSK